MPRLIQKGISGGAALIKDIMQQIRSDIKKIKDTKYKECIYADKDRDNIKKGEESTYEDN